MIPAGVRIFVCTEPIDMRYGFDRLASTARSRLDQDPQHGGALVVFSNRGANRLKVLWFDRNGYCLLYKRLHRAVFELPLGTGGSHSVSIDAGALARLLAGVELARKTREHTARTKIARIDAHDARKNVAADGDSLAHFEAGSPAADSPTLHDGPGPRERRGGAEPSGERGAALKATTPRRNGRSG